MEGAAEQAQGGNLSGISGTGAALGSFNKALSIPTWADRTPEQRMEIMREEVRYLRREVQALKDSMSKVKYHQHAQDGSLMVPMKVCEEDGQRGYWSGRTGFRRPRVRTIKPFIGIASWSCLTQRQCRSAEQAPRR